MRRILYLLFLFLSYRVSGQFKPGAELTISNQKTGYGDSTAHIRSIDFRAWSPLWHGKRSLLSGNITYINEHFSDFPESYGTSVQAIAAGLTWTKIIGSRHSLILSGDIGLFSDFENLDSRAIREKIGLTYTTRLSDRLTLGYGVEYRNQFYGNQLIPVIVVMYASKDDARWRLSGLLPYHPKLTYRISMHHALSAELKQSFSSYELTAAGDSAARFVRNQKLALMVNYEYQFDGHWRLLAGLGYSIRQKYEIYNDADARGWYIINTRIGGHQPMPVASVSQKGVQLAIGIAFNPKF